MGIDIHSNLYYSKKFVDSLSEEELKFTITHEVLHLGLFHLFRKKERDEMLFNICCDLTVNILLKNNKFELIKGALLPNDNDEFVINNGKIKVKDVSKKCAEEIYDELYGKLPKATKEQLAKGNFDVHIVSDEKKDGEGKDGKGKKGKGQCSGGSLTKKQIEDLKEKWKNNLVEATTLAKMKGNSPLGLERFVDKLLEQKINWRTLLHKYITNLLPYTSTWNVPSKKSIGCGVYLPSTLKEELDVNIIVDCSGSVGKEELSEFVTEVVSVAKSFANVNMRILSADTEVHTDLEVKNGNIKKILECEYRGGGGTDFVAPLNYVKDKYPNSRLVVYLTDGFGNVVNGGDYPFKIVWVLSKNSDDRCVKDSGEIIKLE